jgi:hypothetical protein
VELFVNQWVLPGLTELQKALTVCKFLANKDKIFFVKCMIVEKTYKWKTEFTFYYWCIYVVKFPAIFAHKYLGIVVVVH